MFASILVRLVAAGNAVSMKPSRFTGVLEPLPPPVLLLEQVKGQVVIHRSSTHRVLAGKYASWYPLSSASVMRDRTSLAWAALSVMQERILTLD